MENINKEKTPEVTTEAATEDKARPSVPKLSLCCDSIPGVKWVNVNAKKPAKSGNTSFPIAKVTNNEPVNVADSLSPQTSREEVDLNGIKPALVVEAARSATGNAVNSMLNVIRATFKQTEKAVLENLDRNMSQSSTLRSSLAQRGRGLSQNRNCQ